MHKNNKHDHILNSLEGIHRAQPKEELFQKIKQRISLESTKKLEKSIPLYKLRLAAASGLLLFFVNIWSITNHFNKKETNTVHIDNLQSPSLIISKNVYDL